MNALSTLPDIDRLRRLRDRLLARADESDRLFEQLGQQIGAAKARIEDDPEVAQALEALQTLEHQRAVGDYEQLLSLLLQDVLPGDRNVVLDLRTERGLPALDVYLRKGEQPLEDALHGTGGSVTNLLSAGLRFIALMRSGLRPFLVLDEADCWIKPALATKFAAVVQQMAEELGVQVLMISHHDDSLFEPVLPHRLRLESGADGLTAHWAPTAQAPEWAENQGGIRSIELRNFQAHKHTVLPMSPGVTLLQGDNDIGKSAVVKALRSVFYAESNDTFIRHGAKSTQVVLDFGPGNLLSWERNRKGKVKVAYDLNDRISGELLHHSEGARDTPDWLSQFGIGRADDLDIQLGDQHDPVFLLNKRASERAKALAVGDDAGHVQKMLAIGKQQINEARAGVRQGEKQMETLHRIRAALTPVRARQEQWEETEALLGQVRGQREQMAQAVNMMEQWRQAQAHTKARAAVAELTPVELPTIQSSPRDTDLLQRWRAAQVDVQSLDAISSSREINKPTAPQTPTMTTLAATWRLAKAKVEAMSQVTEAKSTDIPTPSSWIDRGNSVLARWKPARARAAALEAITGMQGVDVIEPGLNRMGDLMARWVEAQEADNKIRALLDQDKANIEEVDATIDREFDQCPTCHQELPPGHHEEHLH